MSCLLSGHQPIRERQADGAWGWRCFHCYRLVGESRYPASETFQKRQIAAVTKIKILKARTLRLVRRA